MKLYNFYCLIEQHSVTFTFRQPQEGHYDAGKWVAGEPIERELRGAIIPMSERKIYSSGGTYTTKDRQLYLLKPLEGALKGAEVVYKQNVYSVEESTDYSDYADVAVYTLRWVSALDRKQE